MENTRRVTFIIKYCPICGQSINTQLHLENFDLTLSGEHFEVYKCPNIDCEQTFTIYYDNYFKG